MMARAIKLSLRGYPAPNPHVGCVIANGTEIVGEGYHDHAGGPHAEAVALLKAGARAKGATVYVTLEPCNHFGRTPPCSEALIAAGVKRVVAAGPDPNPRAVGGLARLREAGIETSVGLMADEARAANLAWLKAVERGWPFVVVKAAMTLDGKIATPSGESKWITGEAARKEAHRLRAICGAVLVGRGTVEQDDPQLTVRAIRVANQPIRIVLDSSRNLTTIYRVLDSQASTIRVVADSAGDGELQVGFAAGSFDLGQLLKRLFARGVTSLMVEGGGHTIGSFLDAGLVDRLELFVSAKVFGAGKSWAERGSLEPLPARPDFQFQRIRMVGDDLWITAVRK
jgi:diaminohydroxyphosphoribosylaminopyrimidine deaminase / 5-amino-6-(5-phosphoribosylamino)uracil reductase